MQKYDEGNSEVCNSQTLHYFTDKNGEKQAQIIHTQTHSAKNICAIISHCCFRQEDQTCVFLDYRSGVSVCVS